MICWNMGIFYVWCDIVLYSEVGCSLIVVLDKYASAKFVNVLGTSCCSLMHCCVLVPVVKYLLLCFIPG